MKINSLARKGKGHLEDVFCSLLPKPRRENGEQLREFSFNKFALLFWEQGMTTKAYTEPVEETTEVREKMQRSY